MSDKITTNLQRVSDPVLAELLQMVTETHGILRSHMHDHDVNQQAAEIKLNAVHEDVLAVRQGFPNDDPMLHRAIHESEIQRIKDRAEFWKKMTYELSKYGLIGFLGWAVYALWNAFLHGPGK